MTFTSVSHTKFDDLFKIVCETRVNVIHFLSLKFMYNYIIVIFKIIIMVFYYHDDLCSLNCALHCGTDGPLRAFSLWWVNFHLLLNKCYKKQKNNIFTMKFLFVDFFHNFHEPLMMCSAELVNSRTGV